MTFPNKPNSILATQPGVSLRKRALPISEEKPWHTKLRCHYCRTQDADISYLICANYPACKCGFCYFCLQKEFGINPSKQKKGKWVCMVCQQLCKCQRCQLRSGKKMATSVQEKIAPENDDILKVNDWRKETCLSCEPAYCGPKQYSHQYLIREKMSNQISKNSSDQNEKKASCSTKLKATNKLPIQNNSTEDKRFAQSSARTNLQTGAQKNATPYQKIPKKKREEKDSSVQFSKGNNGPSYSEGRCQMQSASREEEKKIKHRSGRESIPMGGRNQSEEAREKYATNGLPNTEFPAIGFPEYAPFCVGVPPGNFMPIMGPETYPFLLPYGMINPNPMMFGAPFADPSLFPRYEAPAGFSRPEPNPSEDPHQIFTRKVPSNKSKYQEEPN